MLMWGCFVSFRNRLLGFILVSSLLVWIQFLHSVEEFDSLNMASHEDTESSAAGPVPEPAPVHTPRPAEHMLLLEFVFEHKPVVHPFLKWVSVLSPDRSQFPIQGVHLVYGVKTTNVGNKEFPGGMISNFNIKHTGEDTAIQSYSARPIAPLAPGSSCKIWIANTVFHAPGPIWVSCKVTAKSGTVQSFQCSRGQRNEVPIKPINNWSNGDYILPHADYLQARTNTLILTLTVIVVIDAVLDVGVMSENLFQLAMNLFDYTRDLAATYMNK